MIKIKESKMKTWIKRGIIGGVIGIIYFIITYLMESLNGFDPAMGGFFVGFANLPAIILISPIRFIFVRIGLNFLTTPLIILGDFLIGAFIVLIIGWIYDKFRKK